MAKRIFLAIIFLCIILCVHITIAQTDSTFSDTTKQVIVQTAAPSTSDKIDIK